MKVFTYTEDARLSAARAVLEEHPSIDTRIHLLPIPTKKFLPGEPLCDAFLARVMAKDLVCGYGIPAALADAVVRRGGRIFEEEADAEFIEENARLTAEATVGYLLAEPKAPCDRTVGIIGYGRIGQALCRMLLFFGAGVRIFTERESVRTALGEAGIESRPIRYEAGTSIDTNGLDLLIQTAPAKIFTLDNAPPCPLWNLAAAPYIGEGVAVRQLSALPAGICYESGGKALARAVLRALQDNERKTL